MFVSYGRVEVLQHDSVNSTDCCGPCDVTVACACVILTLHVVQGCRCLCTLCRPAAEETVHWGPCWSSPLRARAFCCTVLQGKGVQCFSQQFPPFWQTGVPFTSALPSSCVTFLGVSAGQHVWTLLHSHNRCTWRGSCPHLESCEGLQSLGISQAHSESDILSFIFSFQNQTEHYCFVGVNKMSNHCDLHFIFWKITIVLLLPALTNPTDEENVKGPFHPASSSYSLSSFFFLRLKFIWRNAAPRSNQQFTLHFSVFLLSALKMWRWQLNLFNRLNIVKMLGEWEKETWCETVLRSFIRLNQANIKLTSNI